MADRINGAEARQHGKCPRCAKAERALAESMRSTLERANLHSAHLRHCEALADLQAARRGLLLAMMAPKPMPWKPGADDGENSMLSARYHIRACIEKHAIWLRRKGEIEDIGAALKDVAE